MASSNMAKYQSSNPLQKFLVVNFLKTVAGLVDLAKPNTILDVGCGEGFVMKHLFEQNSSRQFIGLDASSEALEIAKRLNPQGEFVIGDTYQLPWAENSFDLVLALEVLEHLNKPGKAIGELRRVTKKYCILSVPNEPFFSLANLLRGRNLKRFGQDIDHKQFWSKKNFLKLISQYFLIVQIKIPFPWTTVLVEKK